MNLQDQALDVLIGSQALKQHYWEAHGERDTMPVLGYLAEGADELGQVPPDFISQALALSDDLGSSTHMIFSAARGEVDFRTIIVVADGYTSTRKEMPERGRMEEDFKSNPSSDVCECLIVTLASKDLVGGCDVASAMSRYRVVDGGAMVFDDPETSEGDDVQGRVAEALRLVFKEQES